MAAKHSCSFSLIGAVILKLGLVSGCSPTNYVVTSATVPECTAGQVGGWPLTQDSYLGVRAVDPHTGDIGPWPAERSWWDDTWFPIERGGGYMKRVVCGKLDYYAYAGDADWNVYIIPSSLFSYLITEPLAMGISDRGGCELGDSPGSETGVHDCDACDDCMEAELNPDQSFEDNPFFPISGESPLRGESICAYGPWVADDGHGMRPEIHPAELLWWKEEQSYGAIYWLMHQQDDSPYFDDREDFDFDGDPEPADWQPWANAPRTGRFSIAFEVKPTDPAGALFVQQYDARNVVTQSDANARLDADDGSQHALEFDGMIIFRVYELQPEDDDVGVTFADLCRLPDGTIRGNVNLTSKVSIDDYGKEGYQVLTVLYLKDDVFADDPITPRARSVYQRLGIALPTRLVNHFRLEPATGTIRQGVSQERKQLVADFDVIANTASNARVEGLRGAEFVEARETRGLRIAPTQNPAIVRLAGVPITSDGKIRLTATSGAATIYKAPSVGLGSFIRTDSLESRPAKGSTWKSLVNLLSGTDDRWEQGNLQLHEVTRWSVGVTPMYAVRTGEELRPEDESPLTTEINKSIVQNDRARLRDLFGTENPFVVHWTFEAINLRTGVKVQVGRQNENGLSATGEIQAQVSRAGHGENRISISFGKSESDAVYEVLVSAHVVDAMGDTATSRIRIHNFVITENNRKALVSGIYEAAAKRIGVPLDTFDKMSRAAAIDVYENDQKRDGISDRIGLLKTLVMISARDRRISLSELRLILRGTMAVGSGSDSK